jgi:DNA-binding CsgD family transcriptional regulator
MRTVGLGDMGCCACGVHLSRGSAQTCDKSDPHCDACGLFAGDDKRAKLAIAAAAAALFGGTQSYEEADEAALAQLTEQQQRRADAILQRRAARVPIKGWTQREREQVWHLHRGLELPAAEIAQVLGRTTPSVVMQLYWLSQPDKKGEWRKGHGRGGGGLSVCSPACNVPPPPFPPP